VDLEALERLSGLTHRNQSLVACAADSLKIDPGQLRTTRINGDLGWV
jgi:hypothetical protein